MEVVSKIVRMRAIVEERRRQGRTLGLVPTMGGLHEGHLSLVRLARDREAEIVVSIFVNPRQFESGHDYESYPRDLTRDVELLAKEGVKYVFAPSLEEMYPAGFQTHVEVEKLTAPLLGLIRPGHFRGVATVVMKLLNIVRPDFAVFGWKDAQQLLVIQRLVADLDVGVEILGAPTVREADGLASSSRNALLDERERAAAPTLYRALQEGRRAIRRGERSPEAVRSAMRGVLEEESLLEVEHAEVVRLSDLSTPKRLDGALLLAVSAVVRRDDREGVRLIDNLRVKVDDGV